MAIQKRRDEANYEKSPVAPPLERCKEEALSHINAILYIHAVVLSHILQRAGNPNSKAIGKSLVKILSIEEGVEVNRYEMGPAVLGLFRAQHLRTLGATHACWLLNHPPMQAVIARPTFVSSRKHHIDQRRPTADPDADARV